MTKTKIKLLSRQIFYGLFAAVLLFAYYPNVASAAQITARKVVIGSSVASASTTYAFTFTVAQATTIKSVSFAACTTASGACTPAPGFSASTSTLASSSNLGSGGTWTVSAATAGELRMLNTSNTGAPSAGITANFTTVTNPSATNSTFFMRISTYSDAVWTLGNTIDTGSVATSTAGQITVTASVDEALTFTLASAIVALGVLTTSSTGTGTSSMTVGTNGSTGYSVSYSGTTLTSGSNTITAMATAAGSTMNSKQFGINLMANTTPSIGTGVSVGGSGTASTGYSTANQYKFNVAGDVVAAATIPTNSNVFTTSYIANIDALTPAGAYSTVITYTATANF